MPSNRDPSFPMRDNPAQPRRLRDGSPLPVERAFVVHFGPGGGPGRRRFHGRAEHLSSGRTVRFSSLQRLLAFLVTNFEVDDGAIRGPRRLGAATATTTRDADGESRK
jgi:hypothetical protein